MKRPMRKRTYTKYKRPANMTPEERAEENDPIIPLSMKDRIELLPQMPRLVQHMVNLGLMRFADPNNERTE